MRVKLRVMGREEACRGVGHWDTGNSAGVFPGPSPQLTKSQLYLWLNLWGLGPNDVLIRKMRGEKRKKQESYTKEGFTGGAAVKNLLANAGDAGALGSIPGLGRSPGGGNGNPLQYSCLGNPTDRGAWEPSVHGVAKSRPQLRTHTRIY